MRTFASWSLLLAMGCAGAEATAPPAVPAAAPPSANSSTSKPSSTQQRVEPPAPAEHQHNDEHQHAEGHHGAGFEMSFADVERFAKHFDDPARDTWQKPEEVVRHLDVSPGQTLADIGAGTGYFLPYLSKAVGPKGKVVALDVEPKMVDYMKRRVAEAKLANVEPATAAANDPNLPANAVDRILIVNTWHHIGQRAAYSAKLARSLKPGGSVLIVDFTHDSDIGPPAEHRLSPEQVANELGRAGLKTSIVSDETLPKQYLVRAVKR